MGSAAACACADGSDGAQTCGSDGTFDACDCSASMRCEPGALFACVCEEGIPGAQSCNASGSFDRCVCGGAPVPSCVPGTAAACVCPSGDDGAQVCTAAGAFGACACVPTPERCVAGATLECSCAGVFASTQTCGEDGRYAPCDCRALDAGPTPDGGTDAAVPICDPYRGETCGCPEVTPPAAPTLTPPPAGAIAGGPEKFVDVFPTQGGIVVVLDDGVRLLSRAGVELGRWTAPREVVAAAFDGERIVVIDHARAIVLGLDLTEGSQTDLTLDCTSAAMVSCGRLVCTSGESGPGGIRVYDLATGSQLSALDHFSSGSVGTLRVPGVDAVITNRSSSSYVAIHADGRAIAQWTSYGPTTMRMGFIGSPARHLVDADGRLHRLDACPNTDPYASRCLIRDGSLGTLRTGEVFVALDRGADGFVYALTSSTRTTYSRTSCSTGCAVQRIDSAARVVESAGSFTTAITTAHIRLQHDAWAGRVVIGTPQACAPEYAPVCTGWSLALAAYE